MAVALFDIDSLFYQCVHHIVKQKDIKSAYKGAEKVLYRDGLKSWKKSDDFMLDLFESISEYVKMSEFDRLMYAVAFYAKRRYIVLNYILEEALFRLNTKSIDIYSAIERAGIKIDSHEIYITRCRNSIRKKIYPKYKFRRKNDKLRKYINLLRDFLIDEGTGIYDDEYEADDLIADRAKELKAKGIDYIIISIDKDLKQIPGKHFDYYPLKKDCPDGTIDPKTKKIKEVFDRFKGLTFTSNFDSYEMIALQMLMGDSGDDVPGLIGVGPVNAKKILSGVSKPKQFIKIVYREYINHWSIKDHKKEFMINLRLLKLGKSLRID